MILLVLDLVKSKSTVGALYFPSSYTLCLAIWLFTAPFYISHANIDTIMYGSHLLLVSFSTFRWLFASCLFLCGYFESGRQWNVFGDLFLLKNCMPVLRSGSWILLGGYSLSLVRRGV